jgi:Ulp1 family protease
MDKLILSYQDACLYESDLKILQSESAWLNDRIISFYFEYLQKEVYETDDILFIGEWLYVN